MTRINLDVPRGDHSSHHVADTSGCGDRNHRIGIDRWLDLQSVYPNPAVHAGSGQRNGGVFQLTTGWPSQLTKLDAFLGKAGYEGIHADRFGNIYIIEDTGGAMSSRPPRR